MADRKVSWGVDNRPGGAAYDMQQGTRDVFLITDLLNTIARPSQVRQIIAQINPDFVHTYRESIYPLWIIQSDEHDI